MSTASETVSNVGKLVRYAIGAAMSPIRAGDEKIAGRRPDATSLASLKISSDVFLPNQPLPAKYSADGQNISPPLAWSGIPRGTRELVLICEDPDAPRSQPFVHWIMHRLPPDATALPEGMPTEREISALRGAVQGQNDAKTRGWFGPRPPMGHGVHHYHFQLFAVDTQLSLGPDATRDEFVKALKGHVLAEGEVVGTFETRMA